MKFVQVLLAILMLFGIAHPAGAAFPIRTQGIYPACSSPHHRIQPFHMLAKEVKDYDGREGWPGIVAIAAALLAFITIAGPIVIITYGAAAIAIVFGLVGLDKTAYKRTGLAVAGIIAGLLVFAVLLL